LVLPLVLIDEPLEVFSLRRSETVTRLAEGIETPVRLVKRHLALGDVGRLGLHRRRRQVNA
jgi:hypothetical protein